MRFLSVIFFALFFSVLAQAQSVRRLAQDVKLPTQGVIEQQTVTNPIAASATRIVTGAAGATSAAEASLTTFSAQPDVPRNLTITPTGTTTDVESCVVTVTGTNIFDKVITETFSFAANASTATTGNKAFKTVTNVAWAASCESGSFGATWNIGVGEKLGLKRCMADAGGWLHSARDGVKETTAATVAASATAVESNTADVNGTMDGSTAFKFWFIQNYGCFP